MRITLSIITFLIFGVSCKDDDIRTPLDGTTWKFDRMELLDQDGNVTSTIVVDPDTIAAYRIYFGRNGYITHYNNTSAKLSGCGEFKVYGDSIISTIHYGQVVPGLCANNN